MSEQQFVKVAEVYLIREGEDFTGLELGWTNAVLSSEGAAGVLDLMRSSMNSAAWTTAIVGRADSASSDAGTGQVDEDDAGEDGGV